DAVPSKTQQPHAQAGQRPVNQTGNWPTEPDDSNTEPTTGLPVEPMQPARGQDDAVTVTPPRGVRAKRPVRDGSANAASALVKQRPAPARKHDEPADEPTGASAATKAATPTTAPNTTHRARSGSLNVNEF
ncbi:MAG: hypothetical protein RL701_8037, partial [Pseudomonadota bacterium]